MTIFEEYSKRATTVSDINEHLPALRTLAGQCQQIAEFGVRTGNSTIALLTGLADKSGGTLWSYDINPPQVVPPLQENVTWHFTQADTAKLTTIPLVDLLFIDTLHTCDQVRAELRHAGRVAKYLVFHDTVLFGWRDEHHGKGIGINPAIFEFLLMAEGLNWWVHSHATNNNGLTVLQRRSPLRAP